MKFLPSLKSAKSFALVAATIATEIVSSTAPSQAAFPSRIVAAPGRSYEIAIFGDRRDVVLIGCTSLRNMWNEIPTTMVNSPEYQSIIESSLQRLSRIDCNAPNLVQGYTSSGFGKHAGVIVSGRTSFYISTTRFFDAIGIIPTQLNVAQTNELFANNPNLNINTVLEPKGNFIPTPPAQPPASPKPPAPSLRRLLTLRPDSLATDILQAPGTPELVIFSNMNQSFTSGCQAVRNLWSRMRTRKVSNQEFQGVVNRSLAGQLFCNQPTQVKGYTSPAFSPHAGVIVTNGSPFIVRSSEVFNALGITPTQLSEEEGQNFIDRNRSIINSTVITPNNR